nr:MAG: replication associated protein [Arizlama virus]
MEEQEKDFKLRNFCAIVPNYTEEQIKQLTAFPFYYIVFAKEIAPTTGLPHLQVYGEFTYQQWWKKFKAKLPFLRNIEPRYGTQQQAIDYIKNPESMPEKGKKNPKPEDLYEVGEPKKQGKSKDSAINFDYARELIRNQCTLDIEDQRLNLGVIRAYEKLLKYDQNAGHRSKPRVIWYYGSGGSGKTEAAYRTLSGTNIYKCDLMDSGWLEGYNFQESVIIDDFVPDPDNEAVFKMLLQMFQGFPLRVPVKGSSTWFTPKTICVTSQKAPWQIYYSGRMVAGDQYYRKFGPELFNSCYRLKQLMRRIDLVEYVEIEEGKELIYPEMINIPEKHKLS